MRSDLREQPRHALARSVDVGLGDDAAIPLARDIVRLHRSLALDGRRPQWENVLGSPAWSPDGTRKFSAHPLGGALLPPPVQGGRARQRAGRYRAELLELVMGPTLTPSGLITDIT